MNTMRAESDDQQDEMSREIEFSKDARGRFYESRTALNLPVYVNSDVHARFVAHAKVRGIDIGQLANESLDKAIELIETAP